MRKFITIAVLFASLLLSSGSEAGTYHIINNPAGHRHTIIVTLTTADTWQQPLTFPANYPEGRPISFAGATSITLNDEEGCVTATDVASASGTFTFVHKNNVLYSRTSYPDLTVGGYQINNGDSCAVVSASCNVQGSPSAIWPGSADPVWLCYTGFYGNSNGTTAQTFTDTITVILDVWW